MPKKFFLLLFELTYYFLGRLRCVLLEIETENRKW